jgi:16S rRNA (guanine1207-N2)-methyltransferase
MHYFENKKIESQRKKIFCRFKGKVFMLWTDKGVFSKDEVDKGSLLLIKSTIEKIGVKNKEILDVGCGYGLIGIILKEFGAKYVLMIDINKRATRLAKDNIKLNKIEGVEVKRGDFLEMIPEKKFDIVVCNPPIHMGKDIVIDITKKTKEWLKDNGVFLMVIMTRHGGKSIFEELTKIYSCVEEIDKESGYRIFLCKI